MVEISKESRAWRVLAEERRIDGPAVVGEAHEVLDRGRLLALDADELLEQAGAAAFIHALQSSALSQ
jgi:coenzyme F420-reducing hydrogenase beta subunit